MKQKKYRQAYDINAIGLLPWVVEQWYPMENAFQGGRWCIIAGFYRRSDARMFVRELRVDQRPIHSELIPHCMMVDYMRHTWK